MEPFRSKKFTNNPIPKSYCSVNNVIEDATLEQGANIIRFPLVKNSFGINTWFILGSFRHI